MVLQGICTSKCYTYIYMRQCSRWLNLSISTHDLGHYLRLLWQTTNYGSLSTCSIPFMHRTCAGANIRLLVVVGSPLSTGRWVSQYYCDWYYLFLSNAVSSQLEYLYRCWCDWRYIQSCRTRWILWAFHAWSFGALKRKEIGVYRCSLYEF